LSDNTPDFFDMTYIMCLELNHHDILSTF
jgi:hypothetical protein